jgi:hypothetical protein
MILKNRTEVDSETHTKTYLMLVDKDKLVVYKTPVIYDAEKEMFHLTPKQLKGMQTHLIVRGCNAVRFILHSRTTVARVFEEDWEL